MSDTSQTTRTWGSWTPATSRAFRSLFPLKINKSTGVGAVIVRQVGRCVLPSHRACGSAEL